VYDAHGRAGLGPAVTAQTDDPDVLQRWTPPGARQARPPFVDASPRSVAQATPTIPLERRAFPAAATITAAATLCCRCCVGAAPRLQARLASRRP
jgi:hypothetical protein